jgi:outer membrane protein assembly factor BamB
MQTPRAVVAALIPLALGLAPQAALAAEPSAAQILQATGVQGGLVVHLGCGDGRLTAALHVSDQYVVQGLDESAENVRKARATIRSQGVYGEVSAEQWKGPRLPYAENLVNLIVVEQPGKVTMDEMMRVLAPRGVAYVREGGKWRKTVKPWPADIDEWTHFAHGADGNPVANDRVVGPPKHYQWVADPLWLRDHDTDSSVSTVVTAGGRLFYIIDEAPAAVMSDQGPPDEWFLEARDAFNGFPLWKVAIEHWGWREWKDSWFTDRPDNLPVNLPKRLVAVGDRVYCTLGYHAPVSEVDGATGKVLRAYEGTEDTREIVSSNGTLILSVFREGRLKVMAVQADSGKTLWQTPLFTGTTREYFPQWRRRGEAQGGPVVDPALNPATDGQVVCLIDGQQVVALDFATGRELWRSAVEDKDPGAWVGTVIVKDDVVLYAKPTELIALSAKGGERLWSQGKREIGWLWFQWKDVFVVDGLVWTWSTEFEQKEYEGPTGKAKSQWPKFLSAYDLHTGEAKQQIPTETIYTAPHHHRCYPNKATVEYILTSRRGTEYVNLSGGVHTVDNWVRGTCHLGQMPANGLQYAPPHPCACYINEKLNGFTALAPEIPAPYRTDPSQAGPRLERGPAYGKIASAPAGDSDWPTYRHDTLRSGVAQAAVPGAVKPLWEAKVGDRPSPPIAVGDRVYAAAVDDHCVRALDADSGKQLWEFTAGARVDSPPTYCDGALLFGSADGWVYCVRAADGELAWRFRAAPEDRFIGAFGQVESAWPVHGSVLVENGLAYVVAGRSSHLDGGMWLYALDPKTGEVVHERRLEGPQRDSETIQDNLTPPQGSLSDILEGDGRGVYMRNLAFTADLQPASGDISRIRVPAGFLDDSYFKRVPWTFPGKANWGRVISYDEDRLYILRMFDSLKCLDPNVFFVPGDKGYLLLGKPKHETSQIRVANSASLNPANKPLTVEAWIKADGPNGAILARGGINHGYALVLTDGKPCFSIRVTDKPYTVCADANVVGRWVHLAGVLTSEKQLQVYIDGALAASAQVPSLLVANPGQATEVGADLGTPSGEYESPYGFTGLIDEVRIYDRALAADEIAAHAVQGPVESAGLALRFSFDQGDARDESGNGNSGVAEGVQVVEGKYGKAMSFLAGSAGEWSVRVPVRGMAMAVTNGPEPGAKTLFLAGPPDVVDPADPLGAFEGRKGGLLWTFDATSGAKLAEVALPSPPVFNGIAATDGRVYLSLRDGRVVCFGGA